MRVRVLVDGVYNGPGHRSLGVCRVGDVIEVQGGTYADSLIADGFVEPYVEPAAIAVKVPAEEASVEDETQTKEGKPKRKRGRPRKAKADGK